MALNFEANENAEKISAEAARVTGLGKMEVSVGAPPPCVETDWRKIMSWVMVKTWHTVPKKAEGKPLNELFRDNLNVSWGDFKRACVLPHYIV